MPLVPSEANDGAPGTVLGAVSHAQLDLVSDLAREVTARHDLAAVLSETLQGLRRLMSFGGGSIQLLDDEGWIRMAAADPAPSEEVLALRIPLGSTVGGRVILTERPIYLPDVLLEPDVPADRRQHHVSPGGVRSYLGVPLLAEGRAIGLLQVDAGTPDAFDEADRLLLMSVAPIVAAAIQNARAHGRVAVMLASARRAERQRNEVAALVSELAAPLARLVKQCANQPDAYDEVAYIVGVVERLRVAMADDDAAAAPTVGRPRGGGNSAIDLRLDPTRK